MGVDQDCLPFAIEVGKIFEFIARAEDEFTAGRLAPVDVYQGKAAREEHDCEVQITGAKIAVVGTLIRVLTRRGSHRHE